MTNVIIFKQNNFITHIEVKGHALSEESGRDVVCAGISTVITGICNALAELTDYDEKQITIKKGLVVIPNISEDEKIQFICEVLIVQLKMIEVSYPKYIEISYQ
ncbi:MAG: hypothetical protein K0Q49_1852 [Haloplasmataceae bacterium]|jgi:uncharacterized protein YsxB (DUF464 family)|nr:hypothetical protein [Haloplasmataceae bacterium]